ncbi:MAG: hypothetical protein ATN35_01135 [Epulopiscium sp. Nele67-Bin004]|nr:MAG: hypothetical protein ATN35_01135 [Epulopiscium sp. Nele67-Bin004]
MTIYSRIVVNKFDRKELITINKELVFGLDIGTRTIIGVVGYQTETKFVVVKSVRVEHQERAMMDGQVHDIEKVAYTVKIVKETLEKEVGQNLTEVAIAAAGRVLNTQVIQIDKTYDEPIKHTRMDVDALELYAVELAKEALEKEVNESSDNYFCVGHSVMHYYLEGYLITNLEGHRGKSVSVKLLATFLPKTVVESLYAVTDLVGLEVKHLTLEPIAAMNAIIPQHLRMLNLALVDVGAGTSDIAITKDGTVLSYGMIPFAGDKITETLVQKYLIDFNTADRIKQEVITNDIIEFSDIMGYEYSVKKGEILALIEPVITNLANMIGEKILELNNEVPKAIFCVGGGSQVIGLTEKIAEKVGLDPQRVALRHGEQVEAIEDKIMAVEGPQMVTPYGICIVGAQAKKEQVIVLEVNKINVQLLETNGISVLDALIEAGYEHTNLFPTRGSSLMFKINGERCKVRGSLGEVGTVILNGTEVGLADKVKNADKITITPAENGKNGSATLLEFTEDIVKVTIEGDPVELPIFLKQGDVLDFNYQIQPNDDLIRIGSKDLDMLIQFFTNSSGSNVLVNGEKVDKKYVLKQNDKITLVSAQKETKPAVEPKPKVESTPVVEQTPIVEHKPVIEHKPKIEPAIEYKPLSRPEPIPSFIAKTEPPKATTPKVDPLIKSLESLQSPSAPVSTSPFGSSRNEFLTVEANGKTIMMPNKPGTMFVSVFDHLDFNLKAKKGNICLKLNGKDAAFTDTLKNGDKIQVYWED